jgi:hypothetical protein
VRVPIKLDDLIPSYQRFFESFLAVKICPKRIDASEETLSFNTLTLAIAIVIFVAARSTTGADNETIAPQLVAMAISAFITFVSGYVALIFVPAADGLALARRWAIFFVHVWLASLIAMIVIDGIAVWTGRDRITTLLIDAVFVPGSLTEVQKDTIRAVFFSLIALAILLIKTMRQDSGFTLSCRCWMMAAALGVVMNSALLLAFVYGNLL